MDHSTVGERPLSRTSHTWAARVDFVLLAALSCWIDLVSTTPFLLVKVKALVEGLKEVLCSATLRFRSIVLPA